MAHPLSGKLQSTYFNVLYAYFIIGRNVRSHYGNNPIVAQSAASVHSSSLVNALQRERRRNEQFLQDFWRLLINI